MVPGILLTIAFFFCLTTAFEYYFHFVILEWVKFIVVIPFILILAYSSGWTRKNINRKIFVCIIVVALIFSRNISDRCFLGKEIAYEYSGQDAGFEELYLFRSGKCKITYGNILGVTENHYGTFVRNDTSVLVKTDANISDLEFLTIKVGNEVLVIKEVDR